MVSKTGMAIYDIRAWCQELNCKDTCLLVERLRDSGLADVDIAKVLRVLDDTCKHCYDSDGGCQCWNDE